MYVAKHNAAHHKFVVLIDPSIYYYSEFGDQYYPIVWSYLNCNGWEKTVFDCDKSTYPYAYCGITNSMPGVLCKDGKLDYVCAV